jgi:hypothetical protein
MLIIRGTGMHRKKCINPTPVMGRGRLLVPIKNFDIPVPLKIKAPPLTLKLEIKMTF